VLSRQDSDSYYTLQVRRRGSLGRRGNNSEAC
jgi:hypothetical protein